MGCDIHLHIEVKIDDTWHHYSMPSIMRSYDLFTYMANVRNRGPERENEYLSLPKGLPDDISVLTRFDAEKWEHDGHSHSWLDADEIVKLSDFCNEKKIAYDSSLVIHSFLENLVGGYLFGNSWAGFRKYREDFPTYLQDIRFVFWFDN